MTPTAHVEADLDRLRKAVSSLEVSLTSILTIHDWRPLAALGADWVLIAAAIATVLKFGPAAILPALLVVGNRQRALGNLLHEAAHRNLMRDERRNDLLARILITPALLIDLDRYRRDHMHHHRHLGDVIADPDRIDIVPDPVSWPNAWVKLAGRPSIWWSNFAGHLAPPWRTSSGVLIQIFLWWMLVLSGVALLTGTVTAATFFGLWFVARATVFHAITVFRELCDHYGLQKNGIFGTTRDVTGRGLMRWLIHPRNNGYHLTHHLMPAVPYYHLPRAHSIFLGCALFRHEAVVRRSYFVGRGALIRRTDVE